MIYIRFATIVLWAIFIGMIARYFVFIIKERMSHKELYHQYLIDVDANGKLGLEVPPEVKPPKSLFLSLVTSRTFWMLSFWLITTSGFMMFIVEESCQVLGFGRYGLQSSKLWPEAADAANYSAEFIATSDNLIDTMAIANPLGGYVFGRYMDAEEMKLQWEMKRIEAELKKLGQRMVVVEKQGNQIAAELRIRPISIAIPDVQATGPPQHMPPAPKMAYPRAIDYETHAVRVETQKNMVFTTVSGSKYHKLFCRWLRVGNLLDGDLKTNISKVKRTDAITEGLEPCGTCKPR